MAGDIPLKAIIGVCACLLLACISYVVRKCLKGNTDASNASEYATPMVEVGSTADVIQSAKYRGRIQRLLEAYRPTLLPNLDEMMVAFKGFEEELINKLVKDLGPEPPAPPEEAHAPVPDAIQGYVAPAITQPPHSEVTVVKIAADSPTDPAATPPPSTDPPRSECTPSCAAVTVACAATSLTTSPLVSFQPQPDAVHAEAHACAGIGHQV